MSDLFRVSPNIQILPVIHGSGDFMREIRTRLLASSCDCLAVALPREFQNSVDEGIRNLPYITLAVQQEDEATMNYVPIDPTQPIIAALRIARQEGIHVEFVDLPVASYEQRKIDFPDSFALKGLSMEAFTTALLPGIQRPMPGSLHDRRARWMGHHLNRLEVDHKNIVLICSILDWPWVREAYRERRDYPDAESIDSNPELFGVEPDHLFFALTEFPYITYLYEKRRQELKSDSGIMLDGVKAILLRAREKFLEKHKLKHHGLSSQAFQVFLQYVRNLSLTEHRLTPDLFTLTLAAKQIGGDAFAISLVETAREYPYQRDSSGLETLELGIDRASLDENTTVNMKNRLSETDFVWRTLDLKPEPEIQKKEEWKYSWDPYGQCSWPPEDDKIESFHTHVREQSRLLLSNDLARTEKFTSSVKDGIDIRDTLRNWHTGDIYVREIPPSKGKVEIVVFLFEMEPQPANYPWRQTWYAEHNEESTLCFFATNYLETMTGPGIGQATYGGCMMMFPPRPIPNIWEDPRLKRGKTLEEKLLEAACFHSREKHVTVVSPGPPSPAWRRLARNYNRRLIHIPLNRFSTQTIEKVRRFHVLNGKEVRSFASRFISDM